MPRVAKPDLERIDITRDQQAFLRGRIDFLATWPMTDRPLIDLLANAYLIGMTEAVEHAQTKAAPERGGQS